MNEKGLLAVFGKCNKAPKRLVLGRESYMAIQKALTECLAVNTVQLSGPQRPKMCVWHMVGESFVRVVRGSGGASHNATSQACRRKSAGCAFSVKLTGAKINAGGLIANYRGARIPKVNFLQHGQGPFVMNTDAELRDGFNEYRTQGDSLLVMFRDLLHSNSVRCDPGVLPWRAAHDAAEGLTEGALGLVAERLRDGREAVSRALQAVGGQQHSPAGEVLHGRGADSIAET